MMLITGGSGFIGSNLRKVFPDAIAPTEREMDLRDPISVERAVAEIQPEVVIHLGAKSEVAWSFDNYLDVSNVNYLGTVALAEANRKLNPNLRLFIMASTMETYGHHPHGVPFTEETPQHPMAPYAVAKVASEKYLEYMAYAYGFPYVILRQTNTYGRDRNDFFVVERIITQMLRGDICQLGDPDPWRNFLYIDDLVALYQTVIDQRPLGEVFVTGPDNALAISDLAELCRQIIGFTSNIHWHTIPKRPGEIFYLNSTAAKAEKVLGWTPKVELEDGLRRTVALWS